MIHPVPRACCWLLACLALSACRRPLEKVFEVSTDGASRTGLVTTPRGVLVGNETGFLTLVSREGETVWRTRLEREISARPVVAGDHVVATTRGGEWVGVSLGDGAVKWRLAGQPVVTTPLTSDGERVYVVLEDLALRAIDPATGSQLWERPAPPNAPKRRPLQSPVVAGDVLAVPMLQGGVTAFERATGAVAWHYPLALASFLVTDGVTLYAVSAESKVAALDARGQKKWEKALDRPFPGPPTLAGDTLYLPTNAEVLALSTATGDQTWSAAVAAPAVAVAVSGGSLVVPTADPTGRVLVFRPPATEPVGNFRVDSAVRSVPVFAGDRVLLLGSDGRVVGLRLNEG